MKKLKEKDALRTGDAAAPIAGSFERFFLQKPGPDTADFAFRIVFLREKLPNQTAAAEKRRTANCLPASL